MRQSNKTGPSRPAGDGQRLISLSMEMFYASTYLESEFCRKKLEALTAKLLHAKKQQVLNDAIEYLFKTDLEAYNCLLEVAEALSESVVLERDGKRYQALLTALPVLAWTRYTIASGPLAKGLTEKLCRCLAETVLADGARAAMAPGLYAVDQLPYSHIDVLSITQKLASSILDGIRFAWLPKQETIPFLADGRYLLAVVLAEEGQPLFRWQTPSGHGSFESAKAACLKAWKTAVMPVMTEIMPGCNLEPLLPGGFFNTCRKTDQEIRPAIIKAAVNYLAYALDIKPEDLKAVVGGFGKDADGAQIEEYRISFYTAFDEKIVYGVVWPVYGPEELEYVRFPEHVEQHAGEDRKYAQLAQIFSTLKELGVSFEENPVARYVSEFCDDCGAPLFADTHGELVHAEMPEDSPQEMQLH